MPRRRKSSTAISTEYLAMLNRQHEAALRDLKDTQKQVDTIQTQFNRLRAKVDALRFLIDEELEKNKKGGQKAKAEVSSPTSTAPVTPRRSLAPIREAILTVFAEERKPLRANIVYERLQAKNQAISKKGLWAILSRMAEEEVLKWLGYGTYELPSGTRDGVRKEKPQ